MNNEEKSIEYHLERIKKLKKHYEEEYKKQTDLEVKRIHSKDVDSFIEPKTVMEKQKTAVEFLVEQLGIKLDGWNNSVIREAKEMEKRQIIKAFDYGNISASKTPSGKRYYETRYE